MSKHDRSEVVREWADDLNFAVAKKLWDYPHKYGGSNFSDIRDDEGNYYVDLVLGGGGMLGMAHAGFIHALEESDLRFRAVAGSSAGALSAALLMGIDPDKKWKGMFLGALLGALDGDDLLDTFAGKLLFRWKFKWRLPFVGIPGIIAFLMRFRHRGLISGELYEKELKASLQELKKDEAGEDHDVARLMKPASLQIRHVTRDEDTDDLGVMKLAIVAADITTEKKIVYPPGEDQIDEFVGGAKYTLERWVRASSSVPVVFEPVRMKRNLTDDAVSPLPFVDIVDGGLMSNFPISVFHSKNKQLDGFFSPPRLPTFGVQLIAKKNQPNKTKGKFRYISALINSMVDVGDKEFINSNPDYKRVVTIIDVTEIEPFKSSDSDLEAFNLYLKKKEKISLFVLGYVKGKEFLKVFDWYGYKNLRRDMAPERGMNGENDK
jgi:NTE family protein